MDQELKEVVSGLLVEAAASENVAKLIDLFGAREAKGTAQARKAFEARAWLATAQASLEGGHTEVGAIAQADAVLAAFRAPERFGEVSP